MAKKLELLFCYAFSLCRWCPAFANEGHDETDTQTLIETQPPVSSVLFRQDGADIQQSTDEGKTWKSYSPIEETGTFIYDVSKMSLPSEMMGLEVVGNSSKKENRGQSNIPNGVIHPVIFTENHSRIMKRDYVLAHELVHIKRFDIITKVVLAVALCIHWFNPLLWVMYVLANRDIELSCDETVIFEKNTRAGKLISMEEKEWLVIISAEMRLKKG